MPTPAWRSHSSAQMRHASAQASTRRRSSAPSASVRRDRARPVASQTSAQSRLSLMHGRAHRPSAPPGTHRRRPCMPDCNRCRPRCSRRARASRSTQVGACRSSVGRSSWRGSSRDVHAHLRLRRSRIDATMRPRHGSSGWPPRFPAGLPPIGRPTRHLMRPAPARGRPTAPPSCRGLPRSSRRSTARGRSPRTSPHGRLELKLPA